MDKTEYFYRVTTKIAPGELDSEEFEKPVEDVQEFRHHNMIIAKSQAEDFWTKRCNDFDEENVTIELSFVKKIKGEEKEFVQMVRNPATKEIAQ